MNTLDRVSESAKLLLRKLAQAAAGRAEGRAEGRAGPPFVALAMVWVLSHREGLSQGSGGIGSQLPCRRGE